MYVAQNYLFFVSRLEQVEICSDYFLNTSLNWQLIKVFLCLSIKTIPRTVDLPRKRNGKVDKSSIRQEI